MTSTDLNQIRQVIKEELHPVEVKIDRLETKVDRLESKTDALAGDVAQLQMDVKGIRDHYGMYHARDKREIDEIKTHLNLPLIPDSPKV